MCSNVHVNTNELNRDKIFYFLKLYYRPSCFRKQCASAHRLTQTLRLTLVKGVYITRNKGRQSLLMCEVQSWNTCMEFNKEICACGCSTCQMLVDCENECLHNLIQNIGTWLFPLFLVMLIPVLPPPNAYTKSANACIHFAKSFSYALVYALSVSLCAWNQSLCPDDSQLKFERKFKAVGL